MLPQVERRLSVEPVHEALLAEDCSAGKDGDGLPRGHVPVEEDPEFGLARLG